MSFQHLRLSSATLPAVVIILNIALMSFSHLCLGLSSASFPCYTIPFIIVFSGPLCRVAKVFKFFAPYKIMQPVRWYNEVSLKLGYIEFAMAGIRRSAIVNPAVSYC